MKYDIPTLLALSRNARIDVEKFSSQAASNNLIRRRKASSNVLTEISANHSRDVSNHSLQFEKARTGSGTQLRRPSRQPHDPPQGVITQSDNGFTRFLKEHSSSKHQRVTAGGRIVPMNSLGPAPKMQLPMGQQGVSATLFQSEPTTKLPEKNPNPTTDSDSNNSNSSTLFSIPGGIFPEHTKLFSGSGTLGSQFQLPGLFPSITPGPVTPAMLIQPNISLQSGGQHFVYPENQSSDYFSLLSNCNPYGLGAEQTTWFPTANQSLNYHGASIPVMPATSQPNPSNSGSSSEFSTGSSLSNATTAFSTPSTGLDPVYQATGLFFGQPHTAPQTSAFSQPLSLLNVPQGVPHGKSLQEATKEHVSLSAELSRLDRYMAMHTWDLDPNQKQLLVEQRIKLVRDLDGVRTYKEQLEMIYGPMKSGTAKVPLAPPPDARTHSIRCNSGNVANDSTALPNRTAGSTANRVPSTQGATKSINVSSTVPSVDQQSRPAPQRQKKENRSSLEVKKRTSTKKDFSHEAKLQSRPKGASINQKSGKQETQARESSLNDVSTLLGDTDGWATPTESAPPEIRTVYRKIEEATKRGAPLDGLLQELAAVTARLVKTAGEGSNGSPRPKPKRMQRESSHSQTGGETDVTRAFPQAIEGGERPARLAARRQWASEEQSRTSARVIITYETDDDEESWSSYSTTDSWATIQEGDKRWVERQLLGDGNRETSKSQEASKSAAKTGSQVQKKLDTLGWIQSTSPDRMAPGELRQSSSSTSGNNGLSSQTESTKKSHHPLSKQYFSKDREGLVPQKSAALATSQNVNAHACLPQFDGAEEIPSGLALGPCSTVLRQSFRRISENDR
ncbi:uncharacterized protein ACHE_41151S [Aspergillus chevalieri]|uniref:Uncharacterized protein n=1 Tax=Aspergillus chevalieri TaxID=182096 RepID=A0A7R7VPV4_ASPCH|nr:uncharacterized protein ACHE_41151S [Aspergillus chevalieri]BCR88587.1 hypothetical protein ACHE_41151S [Aspergillus chevalieri]